MITLLRGPRAALARYGVPSDLTLRWDVPNDGPAWSGMRAVMGQLRAALGDATFGEAIAAKEAESAVVTASLAVESLAPRLSPAQRRMRDEHSAATLALYPVAQPRSSPLSRALGDVMHRLVAGRQAFILAPEIERVDLATLRAARAMLRAGQGHLSLLVGHDTLVSPPSPVDAWLRKLKVAELALLEALPNTQVERVDLRTEPFMARRGGGFDERDPRTVESMRAAFNGYAFEVALRLALELSPKLEGDELREAHALAALSAMNLDPNGTGDEFGVGMMEAGFLGALEGETDPLKRAHWSYQLSMLLLRARDEIDSAAKYADQAVREAEASKNGYMDAWARMGRAHVKVASDRLGEAAVDFEAALARLDEPDAMRATPLVLLETARAIAANERARVASLLGRRDDLRHYRRISEAHAAALGPEERPGYDWLAPVDDELMPTAIRVYHSQELARARAAFEPEDERAAARALAGAEMCAGDAAAAKEHLAEAMRISILTRRATDELFGLQLAAVVASVRAGAFDDAERELSIVRGDPRCEDDAPQAEALAMLAMVAAGRGEIGGALERAKAAAIQAERSGSKRTVARVNKTAADALLLVGRKSEARAMVDVATAAAADAGPEARFGVLVTLLVTGHGDDSVVADAVLLATQALPEMSAWWELPRLLPFVKRTLEHAPERLEPGALSALMSAAAQRADCAELVRQIRAAGLAPVSVRGSAVSSSR